MIEPREKVAQEIEAYKINESDAPERSYDCGIEVAAELDIPQPTAPHPFHLVSEELPAVGNKGFSEFVTIVFERNGKRAMQYNCAYCRHDEDEGRAWDDVIAWAPQSEFDAWISGIVTGAPAQRETVNSELLEAASEALRFLKYAYSKTTESVYSESMSPHIKRFGAALARAQSGERAWISVKDALPSNLGHCHGAVRVQVETILGEIQTDRYSHHDDIWYNNRNDVVRWRHLPTEQGRWRDGKR